MSYSIKSFFAMLLPKFFWKRYKFTILFGSSIVTMLWLLSTLKNIASLKSGDVFSDPVPVQRFFGSQFTKYNIRKPIPETWLQRTKCPACFGEDFCQAIKREELVLTVDKMFVPEVANFAFGTYRNENVVVKRLGTNHYFDVYDQFICGNTTKVSEGCDVGDTAWRSYIGSQNAMLISELETAYKFVGKPPGHLTNNLCLTPKLLKEMEHLYSRLRDSITVQERAVMYTSMLINYEAILGKYLTAKHSDKWKFPMYYGACGRIVIEEHGGIPLARYTAAPWKMRAALGLQLLRMIEDFVAKDAEWLIIYPDIRYPNFAVDKDGYVLAIDLDNVMIIDKKNVENYIKNVEVPEYCNGDCFRSLAQGFQSDLSQRPQHCAKVSLLAKDLMYAMLCQKIFSDSSDHKGYHMFDNKKTSVRQERGLLHSPPEDTVYFQQLLNECVAQTGPDGRHEAVSQIKSFLEKFALTSN
ncbi:divergent protein kinase domain 2A-like [Lineus longissimus]|uniref:divergent protein kinase domain 2A-like n=1 Tax=Lineus longissimus TaxID=88925 RepID=UPI00315CFD3B